MEGANKIEATASDNEPVKEEIPAETTLKDPEDKSNPSSAETTSNPTTYDPKNVHYEGDLAIYTDPESRTQYEWSKDKNEWILRQQTYEIENDTYVYTDKDNVKYFWDKEKSAWFPKVDEDFMAIYQMNYGFVDNTAPATTQEEQVEDKVEAKSEETAKQKGEKRKASEPAWFEVDETENTKVYVSNLPTDITEGEFVDLMQKCGMIMLEPKTGKYKIKLYRDAGTNYLKGDALCTYIRKESVELALKLLDGMIFKDHKLKVELAKFQMKGDYDPKLKPKAKSRKEKQKLKKMQDKLLDWRPEKFVGDRAKHEKVVVIKNLFDPAIFDTDVGLILEFQQDLRDECSKLGEVRKVIIYDRHPEGVAQVNMSQPEEADEVVKLMNGRWFMKRQLSAEIWDGKTKFKIAETDSEISERIDKWDKFLEEEHKEEKAETTTNAK